ncbi:hypothetical protein Bca52824_026712 [Brassica carinata]|uniref:Uncharacterized protein n=1 Tax=Brassica carinata TaxID=52824 RepID=A0A8X7SH68_BRACI|nr:hypothetical protein Bca52824_026712 [Brassica carinata]
MVVRGYIAEYPNDEEELEGIDLQQKRYPGEEVIGITYLTRYGKRYKDCLSFAVDDVSVLDGKTPMEALGGSDESGMRRRGVFGSTSGWYHLAGRGQH